MILGAILGGGRSSRFGSDKAEALWRGIRLIDHVHARLATVAAEIVVCGWQGAGFRAVADRPAAGLGPLGGLAGALHHAASAGFDRVLTIPCDTPLLSDALLTALARAPGDAFLAEMPVIGSWRTAGGPALDAYLAIADSDRSVRGWAAALGADPIDLPAPPNINRRADLAALEARQPSPF